MKKMSGLLVIIMVMLLIATSSCAEMIIPMFVGIRDLTCSLDFAGGQAQASADLLLKNSSYQASLTVTLQRKDGSIWRKVNSWSGSGTILISVSGSASAVSGTTYRVVASATVKDIAGNEVDRTSITSSPRTY